MLSPLQRRVATILRDLPEANGFALAGGAALIVHGQISRLTRDLDYFTVDPTAVDRLLPAFVGTARLAGLTVIEEQVASGFARLSVADGPQQTGVDLAADARLLPAERSDLGLVLAAEELAVDKVLAIFGRAEARDFVDLAAVEPHFGLEHLCDLASSKDTGFNRLVFASMLSRFGRLARDEFDVDDEAFGATLEAVEGWRAALQNPGNR